MSDTALAFDGVWKKFRKGERHDSLRDLIPALFQKTLLRQSEQKLKDSEFWALQNVSFKVKRGEALGIIGTNGSGKSTTLKILTGILRPTIGCMHVKGRMSALIEVGAGFHQDLTGRENIYLNGAILGMKRNEIDQKLDEIIEFSGISSFIDTPVKRYSSGMYARLGFSIAAHVNPEILLVDEVLSVGDMLFQQKCLDKMISIKNNGTTIIFVSHNLESVNILCNNSILLEKGKIITIESTQTAIMKYMTMAKCVDDGSDNDIVLTNILLKNNNGSDNFKFKPGDKARLKFDIVGINANSEWLLGFIITRLTDGLVICDYNIPIDNKISNYQLLFDVNLLRGTYSISLHLFDQKTASFVLKTRTVTSFVVEEMISWCGVTHFAPTLLNT